MGACKWYSSPAACTTPCINPNAWASNKAHARHPVKSQTRDQAGGRHALAQRRGPKLRADTTALGRVQRENAQLREQLARAELLISIQKKLSELLGLPRRDGNGEPT